MPKNKFASFRYRILNDCFRNKYKKYTLRDLIDVVSEKLYEEYGITSVSKRTIQDDIRVMRHDPPTGYGAPIVCHNGYYYYEDKDFSIYNCNFSKEDLQTLDQISQLCKQFEGLPFQQNIQYIIEKIQQHGPFYEFTTFPSLLVDFNQRYTGLKQINTLFTYIEENRIIKVTYQSFDKKHPSHYQVHPYVIKEYNNRWFLLGLVKERNNQIYTLPLDRIKEISPLDDFFDAKEKLQIRDYLKNLVGVTYTKGLKPEKVRFRIYKEHIGYIETKPIHESQTLIKKEKEFYEYEIFVVINRELINQLFHLLPSVEILSPESLQLKFSRIIQQQLKLINKK
jgi:predicted DNA-binding transcriptional regulator YafY